MTTDSVISNDRIAIVLDDMVEFYAMRNGVDALLEGGISVDLIVPLRYSERQDLLDETYREIKRQGYNPIREIDKSEKYKILLEPNPTEHYFFPGKIDHEFRIKYKYSLISAKPAHIFLPQRSLVYDAILCYTKREVEILSAYTKTFLVSPMRYKGFQKNSDRPSEKPVLLYAPTFGNISSVDSIEKAVGALRKDYYVVVKAHHIMQYRESEKGRTGILREIADEYYTQEADLVELLKKADVVLSDNSGAIFDALYAEVPVAIYNTDDKMLNNRRIGRLDTYQYQLVERGVVPYTSAPDQIPVVLRAAVGKKGQQRLEKADFLDEKDVARPFVDVMKHYLQKDRESDEYYAMHDVIRDIYLQQVDRIKGLEPFEEEISAICNSKSYKLGRALTAPYRAIVRKGGRNASKD
ncbi:MAG: CDP-glycerol glycerophosphotransferase family protein [Clostridiales bacterium]|nr:CDP-glycerol glycerophosphotransferase family protein [Clostridiales bacterium]